MFQKSGRWDRARTRVTVILLQTPDRQGVFNLLAEAQDQRYRVDAIRRRCQALVEERDALAEEHRVEACALRAEMADDRAGDRVATLEEAEQQRRDLSSMEAY